MHPLLDASRSEMLTRLIREAAREDDEVTETYHTRPRGRGKHVKARPSVEPNVHEGSEHPSSHKLSPSGSGESTFFKIEHAADEVLHKVADKSHIPFAGVLLILLVIVLVIFVAFYFCLRKYWTKFKESDKGAKFKGLDLKSVNLIGQLGKEKVPVQPESDGLTANMEENEEEQKDDDEKKEKEKLGRLQFKLDYDFNSTQVNCFAYLLAAFSFLPFPTQQTHSIYFMHLFVSFIKLI